MVGLADGRAAASQVVEPMQLPTAYGGKASASAAALEEVDEAALAQMLQTVTGVRGAMVYTCKVGAPPEQAAQAKAVVDGVLAKAEQIFSLWVPDSEVNRINAAPRAEPIELSEDMSGVLQAVHTLNGLTKGVYDPACFPLMRYYKSHLTEAMRGFDMSSIEKDPQASAIALYAHWGSFILAKDGKTLTKAHDQAALDLGGIAKGWAIDKSVEALVAAGFENIFVEWGGDVRVKGQHPAGRPWSVSITEPPSLSALRKAVPAGSTVASPGGTMPRAESMRRRTDSGKGGGGGDADGGPPSEAFLLRRFESMRRRGEPSGLGPAPRTARGGGVSGSGEGAELFEGMGSLSLSAATAEEGQSHPVLATIALRDGAAVTSSGDYMQAYWFGDRLFHHIFNPKTKRLMEVTAPALAQATVVVDGSCMVADALATTALAMGTVPKDARRFLDSLGASALARPVEDYMLYAREGPKVIRRRLRGTDAARDIRMAQHDPARVIVIGGGLAGFSAAIEAANAGAQVIMLEKEPQVGGNSAKATSGINGWGTRTQAQQGVQDEERYFERDTFRSGKGGCCDPSLVRVLSTQSAAAIHWLTDEMHVDLSELSQLGGHARKRTHRAKPTHEGDPRPVGWVIMQAVQAYVRRELSEQVEIRTSARVVRLEVEAEADADASHGSNGSNGGNSGHRPSSLPPRRTVTGVTYEDLASGGAVQTLQADAVVLASGGYGCDLSSTSLLRAHRPDLAAIPSTNGTFATGDGVKMGMAVGAAPVDLDKVQLHPTSFVDPRDPLAPSKILGPEALRGSGGILVNQDGERFCNELDLRSKVSAAILARCRPYRCADGREGNPYAWCILNREAQAKFGLPSLRFYKDAKGLFEGAPDFPSLARDVIGCEPEALRRSIEAYARAAAQGVDTATNKNVFPAVFSWEEDRDLMAARVTPAIHYSMGGLRMSAAAELLEEVEAGRVRKLRPIRRLFGAGEVTGGVHGENRLGGNSLLECVVFGRVAGERAATIKQRDADACLSEEEWTSVTFREVLPTDKTHGINTMVFRFNCHGALQRAGLAVGQFLAIRGERDGEWLQGFYSPLSRPEEEGYVEILCRTDTSGGKVIDFLNVVRPGEECYLKAMGGLRLEFEGGKVWHEGREIRQISLLAGGTGIAPMVQIIRAYLFHMAGEHAEAEHGEHGEHRQEHGEQEAGGVRLVYAAEREFDLAFTSMLESMEAKHPAHFRHYVVLNQPPLGWTDGVGYVEEDTVRKYLHFPPQPEAGQLFVICGPPIFELMMCQKLKKLGYPREHFFAYSQPAV